MTRRTADILFGLASQTIYVDCPDGRPSSVTSVDVWDYASDDATTEESATTGSASVETNPNTTIDVISGAGETDPTKVNVAATTGTAIGRVYRIASTQGYYEDFTVAAIDSGNALYAKHPLLNSYEVTTGTVKSTRASITLDTTWVSDTSNLSPTFTPNPRYRVKWTVVISSVTYVYETSFDLVRYNAQHHVSPLDVAERSPNWLDWLGPDDRDNQGRTWIDQAFQSVKFDLYADSKADQAIRNPEAIDRLVVLKTIAVTAASRAPDELEMAERDYRQFYDQTLRAPVLAMDPTGEGGAAVPTPTPIWRR